MDNLLRIAEKTERHGSIRKSITLYRTAELKYHAMVVILSPLFLRAENLPVTFPASSQDVSIDEAFEIYESSQERLLSAATAFPGRVNEAKRKDLLSG